MVQHALQPPRGKVPPNDPRMPSGLGQVERTQRAEGLRTRGLPAEVAPEREHRKNEVFARVAAHVGSERARGQLLERPARRERGGEFQGRDAARFSVAKREVILARGEAHACAARRVGIECARNVGGDQHGRQGNRLEMSDDIKHRLEALTATVEALSGVVEQQARRRNPTPTPAGTDPVMLLMLEELRASRDREADTMRAMMAQRSDAPDPMAIIEVVMQMQQGEERADREHRVLDLLEKGMSLYAISKRTPGHKPRDAASGAAEPEAPADA